MSSITGRLFSDFRLQHFDWKGADVGRRGGVVSKSDARPEGRTFECLLLLRLRLRGVYDYVYVYDYARPRARADEIKDFTLSLVICNLYTISRLTYSAI